MSNKIRQSPTHATRVIAAARRDHAVLLRINGMSFAQIAAARWCPDASHQPLTDPTPLCEFCNRQLYASRQSAHSAVTEALKERAVESQATRDELRALEAARLDAVVEASLCIMQDVIQLPVDRLRAASQVIAASNRRAAMLGLNEPIRATLETETDSAIRDMLGKLGAPETARVESTA